MVTPVNTRIENISNEENSVINFFMHVSIGEYTDFLCEDYFRNF